MNNGYLLTELNKQGWLTTTQVAELFGVSRDYITELTKPFQRKGRRPPLAAHKIGHLRLVRREDAERYQATHPRLGKTIARRAREGRRAAS